MTVRFIGFAFTCPVHTFRRELARLLSRLCPVDVDTFYSMQLPLHDPTIFNFHNFTTSDMTWPSLRSPQLPSRCSELVTW